MILERIVLNDFRCFYGECVIDFSTESKKNVTLIHAENGVGKTTLLNALFWCFYKKTTRRFERKDDIVNHKAIKEGRKIASVEVFFEHNGDKFAAKRIFNISNPAAQNTVKIATVEYGNHTPQLHTAPDTFINSVIPKEMANHFLFDGEHAEAISGEENAHSVGNAVRDILGSTIASHAIQDVEKALREYRKLAASSLGNTEIDQLKSKEDALEGQIEEAKKSIGIFEAESEGITKQTHDINDQLRKTEAVKEIQKRKELLERSLNNALTVKKNSRQKVLNWMGDNGHFLVSKKITEQTFACLDDETTKGKIPAPYNSDFVSGLLEKGLCACGRPLHKGSLEAAKISELLNTASTKTLQDRIIKVRSRLESLRRSHKSAPKKLSEAQNVCAKAEEEIAKLEGQLEETRSSIKNVKFSEIAQKEVKLSELRKRSKEIDQTIGRFKSNIERAARECSEIVRQVDKITSKHSEAKKFVVRRDFAETILNRLKLRLAEEEKSAKAIIKKFITEIIDKTSRKSFRVHMDENFTVTVRNSDGIEMAKSEGENQLLGLAFTAALCKFAKIRKGASGEFLLPGTEAPLVLDSPFGKLDTVYKIATAEFIPNMATQVILMVSKEQGSENVISQLKDSIGAEYCLISHNSSERGEKGEEYIDIRDKRINITVFGSDFDGTEILEVS